VLALSQADEIPLAELGINLAVRSCLFPDLRYESLVSQKPLICRVIVSLLMPALFPLRYE
jgi:hypothetical protein